MTPGHFGVQKVSFMTLDNQHKSHTPWAFLLSVCWRQMVLVQIALERAVTLSQPSSVIIGHWKVSNTLPPLSLVISSPLFSVIANSSKGSGKRVKQTASQLWACINLYTWNSPGETESKGACNSRPHHNQYCIIQVHCLSPKVILFPKELFHSLNLFSFLFSPRIREMPYGKQKSSLKIPSLLNCLSVADIFKSQFSEACIRCILLYRPLAHVYSFSASYSTLN